MFAAPLYFFRYSAGGFGQIRAIKVLCSVQFHVWIISCSSEIHLSVKHSLFSSTLLLLDGSHIGWKRDIIWSESSKGIQMEHSPVISHTILIRLRLKTLWSGWPTPNKKGELGSNICLDAVWISWGFRRSHSLEFVSFYSQLNDNGNYFLLHICFTDVVKLCSTLRQKYETTGIKHVPITALHHLAPFFF